jgi:hypothetical protein
MPPGIRTDIGHRLNHNITVIEILNNDEAQLPYDHFEGSVNGMPKT